MGLLKFLQKIEPDKKKSPFLHSVYDGLYTFFYVPNHVTTGKGVHIRDGIDLKRTMIFVVIALLGAYIFGAYNVGHQHFLAMGQYTDPSDALHLKLTYGFIKIIPILIVSYAVGLGIEFWFAAKKGHGIEEGYLVSGALIPLLMPPDISLWMLALAVVFAVILGKEVFGGTGMNIWNVALLARVFIFFAYPTTISGDEVWVGGFDGLSQGTAANYGWAEGLFNSIYGSFGWETFKGGAVIDGFSGATPLALAYTGGWEAITAVYSTSDMMWGFIPGSIGETSKPLILLGAIFLLLTKVASWRVMLSAVVGAALMGLTFNAWDATPAMTVPWDQHFMIGSLLFAVVFMATDPVTSSTTNKGKWIYGFLIGVIGMLVRVLNPAYPEGWMLAILFMNSFAPLIDYFIVQANIKKRLKRV